MLHQHSSYVQCGFTDILDTPHKKLPPVWGWARPAPSSPYADSPTVRTLYKWSRNRSKSRYERLAHPNSLLLHLLVGQFGKPSGWLIRELQILVKSAVNGFSQHPKSFSRFPDSLPLFILHFGGNIDDWSLCIIVHMVPRHCHQFLLLSLLTHNCLHPRYLQGLAKVDLLDNFLNFSQAFSFSEEWSNKITD